MKKIIFMLFLTFFILSCQNKKIEQPLIDDFRIDIHLVNDIDDLFFNQRRTIQLDTIYNALIGIIGKIIKYENHFYILSDERRILQFDNDGKLLSLIDKRGGGPGEYTRISDFNLFNNNGNTELWISDLKEIRKYVHTSNSWNFVGIINFNFIINKFKIFSDEYILFLTGQNEESLLLTDITGAPLKKYLKKKIPFLHLYPVQFINYDSYIIFKLGSSNECIALDTTDMSFRHINIIKNEKFLSSNNLLDIFNRYDQDYLRELPNTNNIRSFRNTKGNIWLNYTYQGENYVAVRQNGVWKKIKYNKEHNFLMTTIIFSESFDSFILFEYPDDDKLNLLLHEFVIY